MWEGFNMYDRATTSVSSFALMALLLSAPASAQTADADRPQNVTEVLQAEIVVTAQKRGPARVQNVPATITAFGEAQIEALNVRDLKSLTTTMPNVQLDGIGTAKGTANFTIRGLGVNTSVPSIEPTVGVFVDGMYLGINSGVIMDDFDLEAIEVLRGPQGVLFGRNVVGGAVLLRTKRPTNEFTGNARVGLESGPSWTVDGAVSGPVVRDLLSVRVAAYYNDDRGWFKNEFDDSNFGASDLFIVRPSILLTPSEAVDFILRFEHGEGEGDGGVFQNEALFPSGSFRTQSNERGFYASEWNQLIGELNWKVPFGDGTITAIGGWREFKGRDRADLDGTTMTTFNLDLLTKQDQRSAELRYAGTFGNFDVTTGLYYFQQDLFYLEGRTTRFDLSAPIADRVGGGISDHESWSAFTSLDWHITPEITLNAGARYNEEKKISSLSRVRRAADSLGGLPGPDLLGEGQIGGSFEEETLNISDPNLRQSWNDVSPRVGVQWQPSQATNVYAYWAKGFRGGGLNIRHTGLGAPPTLFDAETQNSYEIGIKQDFLDRRAHLNLAVFRSDVSGVQRDINTPDSVLGNVQIITNAGTARVQGFEVDGRFSVTDNILITGNLGYTDGKYTKITADLNGDGVIGDSGDFALKLPRLAPWSYGASVVHNLNLGSRGDVATRISYSHRDASFYTIRNTTVLRSSKTLDASIAFTPGVGHWSLSVYGKNLTNRATWDSQSSFPNIPALGGDGSGGGTNFNALNKGRVIGVNARTNF